MIEWTAQDSRAAHAEGWDIFECSGSENGPWQIQSFDDGDPNPYNFGAGEPPGVNGDVDAWVFVRTKAAEGSPVHVKALAFLREHNPIEADAIERYQKEDA